MEHFETDSSDFNTFFHKKEEYKKSRWRLCLNWNRFLSWQTSSNPLFQFVIWIQISDCQVVFDDRRNKFLHRTARPVDIPRILENYEGQNENKRSRQKESRSTEEATSKRLKRCPSQFLHRRQRNIDELRPQDKTSR